MAQIRLLTARQPVRIGRQIRQRLRSFMYLDPVQVNLASPSATWALLERFGLSLKHRLGQHFLVDGSVLKRILTLADVAPGECLLEVGPGIGTLTQALLAQGAFVVAIERDATLVPALAFACEPWKAALAVIEDDALKVDPRRVAAALATIRDSSEAGSGSRSVTDRLPYQSPGQLPDPDQNVEQMPQRVAASPTITKFVANLPYNVAATLVLDYWDRFPSLKRSVVMVQKEVGERMRAQPGSKDYGAYSVKLGLRAMTGEHFSVTPSAFTPPPHVDSMVLSLTRRPAESLLEALPPEERGRIAASGVMGIEQLIAMASFGVDAAFAQRRKTIANSMRGYFAGRGEDCRFIAGKVEEILQRAGINPTLRGEVLGREDYVRLGVELGKAMGRF